MLANFYLNKAQLHSIWGVIEPAPLWQMSYTEDREGPEERHPRVTQWLMGPVAGLK